MPASTLTPWILVGRRGPVRLGGTAGGVTVSDHAAKPADPGGSARRHLEVEPEHAGDRDDQLQFHRAGTVFDRLHAGAGHAGEFGQGLLGQPQVDAARGDAFADPGDRRRGRRAAGTGSTWTGHHTPSIGSEAGKALATTTIARKARFNVL